MNSCGIRDPALNLNRQIWGRENVPAQAIELQESPSADAIITLKLQELLLLWSLPPPPPPPRALAKMDTPLKSTVILNTHRSQTGKGTLMPCSILSLTCGCFNCSLAHLTHR
ncbi:hypothetical protein KIL84_002429 [Mauremys mutica]|uniref:Uncharacterized protein n=1 Tax=Mauremys mutica TaxID=74926 RepID=A0A9D4AZ99_9SAUR|nr:hypothetical protein KIL84_002429 [Mauremys mutica]